MSAARNAPIATATLPALMAVRFSGLLALLFAVKNNSLCVLTESRQCAKFSHVARSYNRPSGTRKLEREQTMSQYHSLGRVFNAGNIRRSLLTGQPLAAHGYGYSVNSDTLSEWNHPDLDLVVVGTGGMGNCGSFYVRGKTPRGRRVVRKATIRQWMRAGLSRRQAEAYYSLRGQWKHEVVALVHDFLCMPKGAAEAFPSVGGRALREWEWRWCPLVTAEPSYQPKDRLIAICALTGDDPRRIDRTFRSGWSFNRLAQAAVYAVEIRKGIGE